MVIQFQSHSKQTPEDQILGRPIKEKTTEDKKRVRARRQPASEPFTPKDLWTYKRLFEVVAPGGRSSRFSGFEVSQMMKPATKAAFEQGACCIQEETYTFRLL